MRPLLGALLAVALSIGSAFAAQAEGEIRSIDREAMTITLDDGKSYKLPGEFDVGSISEGMTILFAYDEVNGVNMITDIAEFQ